MDLSLNPNSLAQALEFYNEHILSYDRKIRPLLAERNFKSQVPFWKWEYLAATLLNDKRSATERYGSDLEGHEVKSAVAGRGFEYQYHRNSWEGKIKKEMEINHVYIIYTECLENLSIKIVEGEKLKPELQKWLPELQIAYDETADKIETRFRKSLSPTFINSLAETILIIENGKLVVCG